jgi:hypothetical protein
MLIADFKLFDAIEIYRKEGAFRFGKDMSDIYLLFG